jgi:general secretion pathway protein C
LNLALHGRKLSAAIILTTLMLSAVFLARGTTSLVAGSLLPPQPVARAGGVGPVPAPPGSEPPDAHEILKRNIFDPTVGPLWPPKPPPTEAGAESGPETAAVSNEEYVRGQSYPPCEGSTKVLASFYSEKFPEWSFASVSNGSENALLYRLGGRFDEKEIIDIVPKGVVFRQSSTGKLCSALMFAPPQPAHMTPNAPPPVAPTIPPPMSAGLPGAGGISEAEMDANIRAISDTKFSVKKTFVDKILQNQAAIMSSARIVPHEENGQVVGVKLYGIRRNSLLGKLGLQNGDLMRTINGFEMSSPDTALEAYARLRSASNLSVAVVRRGQPMNVQYDIE